MQADPNRIKALFLEALEHHQPQQWPAFLDQTCAGQPDLRRHLEALLKAHREVGSDPALPAAEEFVPREVRSLEQAGSVLGPYRLLEKIGEGGMGTVWMAEQTRPVRRLVALKVIKAGMDSAQVIARFEAERQALALMDHPNIARVFDAGLTDSGRPWFVMELVQGVPITRSCDEQRLTPRQRLELFVSVCQAIQHAHQKGIIHRDVKPSNVLVAPYDGKPVVKVIDFGVAKAIGQPLTERTLHTGFGAVVGTLEYMSPEQAKLNNQDIDTRSDVFSLGVLLYELLTGTTPLTRQELKQTPLPEALRLIREQDPPRPSTRLSESRESLPAVSAQRQTEPGQLTRLVRGELDWIVMKALEKDRERRYETANGLAKDVERYLNDEPVLACPPSVGYRLRKFLRRHKGPVLAGSAMVGLLLGGAAASTWQAVLATRAERKATKSLEAERTAKAQTQEALDALTDSVVGRLMVQQPELGEEDKAFLRKVLGFYEAVAEQLEETPEGRFERAKGHVRVARVQMLLDDRVQAEKSFRQAVTGLEQLVTEFPGVPRYRRRLAVGYHNLGQQLQYLGRTDEAETACLRSVDLLKELVNDYPRVPDFQDRLSHRWNNLGKVLVARGKLTEAGSAFRKAVALQEELVKEHRAVPQYRHQLAVALSNLAHFLEFAEKRQDPRVEATYRRALEFHDEVVAEQPAIPTYRRELARTWSNLGVLQRTRGRNASAEQAFRQARAVLERLTDKYPGVRNYRSELADTCNLLLLVLADQGKPEEAEAAGRQALTLRAMLGQGPSSTAEYRLAWGVSHNNLARVLLQQQKLADAEAMYRRGLDILEKLVTDCEAVAEYRRELARTCTNLGNLLRDQGCPVAAEPIYRQGLEHLETLVQRFGAVPADRGELAISKVQFGSFLRMRYGPAAALRSYEEALSLAWPLYRQAPGDGFTRRTLWRAHWRRAEALGELERTAEALADWDQVLALSPGVERSGVRLERARALGRAGYTAEAVAEAGDLTKSAKTPEHLLCGAADIYSQAAAWQDGEAAEGYVRQALGLLARVRAAGYFNDPRRVEELKRDADLAGLWGREDFRKLVAELDAAGQP